MNAHEAQSIKWSENIIIVDGDYIDRVAFDLIVNFERMLDRRIPAADFSQWVVDVALDGRLRPGNHETQVVLLHDKKNQKLENFAPSSYGNALQPWRSKANHDCARCRGWGIASFNKAHFE